MRGDRPTGLFPQDLLDRAEAIVATCRARQWRLAAAESCTGGLVAALLTEIVGSSSVVDRGFVTYSNEAKADLLGVPWATLGDHGAVSPETARAMASGALGRSLADAAVSITGIAGPGGGSAQKPVGLVHFALARRNGQLRHVECRFGDLGRLPIRLAAVGQALAMIEAACAET